MMLATGYVHDKRAQPPSGEKAVNDSHLRISCFSQVNFYFADTSGKTF